VDDHESIRSTHKKVIEDCCTSPLTPALRRILGVQHGAICVICGIAMFSARIMQPGPMVRALSFHAAEIDGCVDFYNTAT
jgi:hypothetical protein